MRFWLNEVIIKVAAGEANFEELLEWVLSAEAHVGEG